MDYIDFSRLANWKKDFLSAKPFHHIVIDNFLDPAFAEKLLGEFPMDKMNDIYNYDNPLEKKFASNNWNQFPPNTYKFLEYVNTNAVVSQFNELCDAEFTPDYGLHGGGWHIHGNGGKLNPHLDYSIHPKIGLQRKLNLIIYLTDGWKDEYGGHLGFWEHDADANQPGKLMKEVEIRFNRAVLFDTTQNSWHGISRKVVAPEGVYRKSLAIYYLCEPAVNADKRERALFAPTEDQKGDEHILDIIKKRSDVNESTKVYRSK